jgi:hypothetical protein
VNLVDLIPVVLLLLVALATGGSFAFVYAIRRGRRAHPGVERAIVLPHSSICFEKSGSNFLSRPTSWLAVKGRNLRAVQTALGLQKTEPCSWIEGLAGEKQFFIAPPVDGWILVFGTGLPDPSDDVDQCFHFVSRLSRAVGHVQFFVANRALQHHAWVRAQEGHVKRAYAWAGKTLWKQGERTSAERELHVRCFDYSEAGVSGIFENADAISTNVDRVPALAARWSLDPASIDQRILDQACGIAGEPSRR